jgi:hypothetical protein
LEVSGQFFFPAALPWEKDLRYQLDRRLVDPKDGLEIMEKRKILFLPGIETGPSIP